MQMGQTHTAPFKEKFSDESRHFFAVLLDVTQEKYRRVGWKGPLKGLCFLMRMQQSRGF